MPARAESGTGGDLQARLLGTTVLTGVGSALGLASQALIARLVGVDGFGIYSFVLGAVGLAQVWLALDFGSAIMRFVPGYWRAGKGDELRRIRSLGTTIVGITASIGVPVALGVQALWPGRIPSMPLLLMAAALAIVLTLLQLDYLFLLSIGYSRLAVLLQQVLRPATVIGLASAGTLLPIAREYLGVGAALAAVTVVTLVARRAVDAAIHSVSPSAPYALSAVNGRLLQSTWLRYALTFVVSSAAQSAISSQLDVVLVGAMIATRESGVYAAATQLTLVAALLPQVMSNVLAPPFAAAHDAGAPGEARTALARFGLAQTVAALVGVLAVVIGGPVFLMAYGADFGRSYPLALLLSSAYAISAVFGVPASLVLTTTGAHRRFAVTNVLLALLSIGLAVLLVQRLGTAGAAWATLSIAVVRSAVLQGLARRHAPGMIDYRLAAVEARVLLANVQRQPASRP